MEPTKLESEEFKGQVSNTSPSHSEITGMRRDNESIDDFEHLEPEPSPVKEFQGQDSEIKIDELSKTVSGVVSEASHAAAAYNKDMSFIPDSKFGSTDEAKSTSQFGDDKFVSSSTTLPESVSLLYDSKHVAKPATEVEDLITLSTQRVEPDMDELSTGEFASKVGPEMDISKLSSQKALSQAFMDFERENTRSDSSASYGDTSEKITPDVDFLKSETKPTNVPEYLPTDTLPTNISSPFHDTDKNSTGSNIQDSDVLLDPLKDDSKLKGSLDESGYSKSFLSAQDDDFDIPSQDEKPEKPKPVSKPMPLITEPHITSFVPLQPASVISEPHVKPDAATNVEPNIKTVAGKPDIKPSDPTAKSKLAMDDSDLEEIKPIQLFHSMGLDAWFKPDRLHPKVVELVYWRDPKKSGIVFGSVLGVLLSLSYFSLISVVAYLSLALLTGTISFRIYKNVLQAVQKTSDGHPFKDILELDLTLPQDKVREVTDIAVAHVNAAALELRRLFLVEDLVDSIKFGVLLWCLTYVGSWFNGMTLIIIAFVALFTLPKVYENNKAQIDQNLDVVRSKVADITSKVKAAIPLGKKAAAEEDKKDQ